MSAIKIAQRRRACIMKMSDRPGLLRGRAQRAGRREYGGGPCVASSRILILAGGLSAPAAGVPAPSFDTADAILRWIYGYSVMPDPARVPDAVKTLSRVDAFRETENSAVYVGFVAGVIAANPRQADELIGRMLPIKTEDQWVLVRAIAYSGTPGWKDLLARFAGRMPTRAADDREICRRQAARPRRHRL